MLKLSWAKGPAADAAGDTDGVLIMVSKLELRSMLQVVPFLLASMKIRRQAIGSAGGIGHALAVEPGRRTFWTQSAWIDRDSLQSFNGADPHKGVVDRFRPRMAESVFVFVMLPRRMVALDWDDVRSRIVSQEAGSSPRNGSDPAT